MQEQCTIKMAAVINSMYMSAVQQVGVPFKILMWTLLACERRLNILLLMCVCLLHENTYRCKFCACEWGLRHHNYIRPLVKNV